MGLNSPSKTSYHQSFLPLLKKEIEGMVDKLILECRLASKLQVDIVVDGSWSHPGWWSNECTVLTLDAKTGVPLGRKHIIKNHNYFGSSRGKFQILFNILLGMEGYGVLELMKELKNWGFIVSRICHDNDASTLKHAKDVFEDVEEVLCTSIDIFHSYI